jgi:hypothetical protein
MEVPSKLSVGCEGEIIKFFERHKTKRKTLHDIILSRKLLNSSKGVNLHVSRIKSARGRNYSKKLEEVPTCIFRCTKARVEATTKRFKLCIH